LPICIIVFKLNYRKHHNNDHDSRYKNGDINQPPIKLSPYYWGDWARLTLIRGVD